MSATKDTNTACKQFTGRLLDKTHHGKTISVQNLFIEVNPIPIKEAMNQMKMPSGPCRLPLCEMTDEHIETLKNSMKKIGLI